MEKNSERVLPFNGHRNMFGRNTFANHFAKQKMTALVTSTGKHQITKTSRR
jgi:hypothetical protein